VCVTSFQLGYQESLLHYRHQIPSVTVDWCDRLHGLWCSLPHGVWWKLCKQQTPRPQGIRTQTISTSGCAFPKSDHRSHSYFNAVLRSLEIVHTDNFLRKTERSFNTRPERLAVDLHFVTAAGLLMKIPVSWNMTPYRLVYVYKLSEASSFHLRNTNLGPWRCE
jgi:hypothetical protein